MGGFKRVLFFLWGLLAVVPVIIGTVVYGLFVVISAFGEDVYKKLTGKDG